MSMEKSIFWDYLVFYPYSDEKDYDGIHDGGVKGILDDAPDEVKRAFETYMLAKEQAERDGIKL